MTDPRTIDAYNDRSEEYEKKFDNDAPGPHLLAFMNMLTQRSSQTFKVNPQSVETRRRFPHRHENG